MIEFLQTLDPALLTYYIILLVIALILTLIFVYYQTQSSFDHGFNCGKSDLDQRVVKAENAGYRKGYAEGKDAGIFMGKSHAQQSGQNALKTPVKQPPKPINNRRPQSGRNKRAVAKNSAKAGTK